MEHNEISMCMDVKLDTHDKRAIALHYKSWTRCQVKIEAIKCVPCFLRLSFQRLSDLDTTQQQPQGQGQSKVLTISVNVPGVSLSLASSRTKQHSYGLFWTQNRRDCFIYFALETETACRRHMKWIKKSIKNLELYRQVFLEQRRLSRGVSGILLAPDSFCFDVDISSFNFTPRDSQIYEEIFDGSRISRASIASGIYEEMKPTTVLELPPTLPPLPALRKRINTFESAACEIPRCSTNPESELAKKKKYKTMLDNIFKQKRRSASGSVPMPTPQQQQPIQLAPKISSNLSNSHRHSFSSPDLSKLNSLDIYGEELNISLDDSAILQQSRQALVAQITRQLSLESLNVSEQLPHNFNFSACNTSTINLVGANGAVLQRKNHIVIDEHNGYCVMAPIAQKQKPSASTGSSSSGYSTGSYSSTNSNEPPAVPKPNESAIYEPMHGSSISSLFADHLYENLLAVKAAQELENPSLGLSVMLSTSTPTESPLVPALPPKQHTPGAANSCKQQQPEEDYYQTPRKSIISVDEKIPSYYPNSCNTLKSKRRSPSSLASAKQLRERKENLYISSPQQIIEQRQRQPTISPLSSKTKTANKKTAAHKISEGVYAVKHSYNNNNNNNNNNNDVDAAMSMLQHIDFKFDDNQPSCSSSNNSKQLEEEYESCFQAAGQATRMLQKYATLAKFGNGSPKPKPKQQQPAATPPPPPQQQQQQQPEKPKEQPLKKFGTLPRFKKIDFSPFKLRFNNVLQRQAAPQQP
ncbi:sced [Drosophila busckii]|uniref:Sced n=1 Tax=Drosophila busckii TaxID=30019 RepID=A0A0M5J546_DROBS|nr:putative uncharacterized protein DDB_G0285119 [Drosophila busckii]ALC42131.1 sced [Drosophila busckii]